MSGGVRWDSKSDDAKFLKEEFASGALNPLLSPKTIRSMYGGRFEKYSLEKFRNGLSNLKRTINVGSRETIPVPTVASLKNDVDINEFEKHGKLSKHDFVNISSVDIIT
jgi:hypothetical protein